MRNAHIFRTLQNLHFFGVFKIFWDIIWLGCCLNRFVTLGRWSNDIRKNSNPKILKKFTWVWRMWRILTFFVHSQFFTCLMFLKFFLDFILLGYSLNRFIILRRLSNDFRKNLNPKILKKFTKVRSMWGILTFFDHPNSPLVWSF